VVRTAFLKNLHFEVRVLFDTKIIMRARWRNLRDGCLPASCHPCQLSCRFTSAWISPGSVQQQHSTQGEGEADVFGDRA